MSKLSKWLRYNVWRVVLEKKNDLTGDWVEVSELDNKKTWMGLIWYLLRNKTNCRIILYRDWIGA